MQLVRTTATPPPVRAALPISAGVADLARRLRAVRAPPAVPVATGGVPPRFMGRLPNSLAGRDILGRGRTGSGKTLAFGLALLVRISGQRAESRRPRR
ncbi:hypothetical protein Ssi03_27190 [Sphaerisporangium siamense]|nr:hypothetical protein Ssi03_27190 [Sphaerisporangium siamense]